MAKRKEDLKQIVSVAISRQQHKDLRDLAKYTGKNVSEVVRGLLPTKEEIDAFITYQDFCDICEPRPDEVIDKIARTRRLFFETAMNGHIQAPIGLQCASVSYFDKTGKEIAKLFKIWINALRSTRGCRFESVKIQPPSSGKTYVYYVALARNESKEKVGKLICKYCTLAPNAEVLNTIKKTARVKGKKKSGKPKAKKS